MLAEYGWSLISVRHDEGCEGGEVSMHRALLLAMRANQEVCDERVGTFHFVI